MPDIQGRITKITDLTERLRALTICAEGLPAYAVGAHIEVDVQDGQTRAYSLIDWTPPSAAPAEYTIAVQREDEGQGGSLFMHGLQVGDPLGFTTPKNDFPLQDGGAVLLAGGIGVTPMIGLAAQLHSDGRAFTFHYAGRSRKVMAYADALADRFAAQIHCDDDATALDLDAVIASVGQAHLYVCGPRGMIDAARAKAEAAGIAPDHIHFELFENATPQSGDQPFEVELASSGAVYAVGADQTIIEALEAAGVDVMYDCQRGDCGICQCDVVSGVPDHRDVVLSPAERDAGKVMQICVSRAKSPRLVLDL